LVGTVLAQSDPVHKVTILSRGRAAGYTMKLPFEEKHLKTKTSFLDEIAALLGGYAAEKLVFNELTTGASNDLKVATGIARKLVTAYGMIPLCLVINFLLSGFRIRRFVTSSNAHVLII
jgi:cell division protease FtsH